MIDNNQLPLLGASPDGLIHFDDGHCEVLEVKNSAPFIQSSSRLSINKAFQFKGLGSWFIPQLQLEILCSGKSCTSAILLQLSAMSGAIVYRVERDNTYITMMLEFLHDFYIEYVLQDKVPPPNFFMTELHKEKYKQFLQYTKKVSESAKVIAIIPQRDIQRSSLNTNFFC